MAYPRFLRSRQMVKARRTSGNLTLNSTSWANVDTGLDLTLNEVQVGDEIVYGIGGLANNEAVFLYFDVATIVSAAPVNYFGTAGGASDNGVVGWFCASGAYVGFGGLSHPYTIQAGDLTDGSVTLRLRYRTQTAGNRVVRAVSTDPLDVWAMNLGPLQG